MTVESGPKKNKLMRLRVVTNDHIRGNLVIKYVSIIAYRCLVLCAPYIHFVYRNDHYESCDLIWKLLSHCHLDTTLTCFLL